MGPGNQDLEIRAVSVPEAVALAAVGPPGVSGPQGSCPAPGVGMEQPPSCTAELGLGLHCLMGAEKSTPPLGSERQFIVAFTQASITGPALVPRSLDFE